MLKGRHSISNASVIACNADLVAVYMLPHGRGLETVEISHSVTSMRGEGACVPLRDDGANGDEHPLLASGHVGEHCSVYAENRQDVRVKGHLDLFEWQFQRWPLRSIHQVKQQMAKLIVATHHSTWKPNPGSQRCSRRCLCVLRS
jgi:hypothetical protein